MGSTIGALWVGRKNPFSPAEVRLLTAIADIAANAIHRSSLFEKTRLSLQRLAALHEIDTAINSTLDLQITLKVLLEQVINQLRVDAAAVLLLNPQQHTLTYRAGRGFRTRNIERATQRLGEGHAGQGRAGPQDHPGSQHPQPGEHLPAVRAAGERRVCQLLCNPPGCQGPGQGGARGLPPLGVPPGRRVAGLPRNPGRAGRDRDRQRQPVRGPAAPQRRPHPGLRRDHRGLVSRPGHARPRDRGAHPPGHRDDRYAGAHLGLPAEELVHVRWGALLHDIGKMGVPDSILSKPGPLDPEEWVEMRKHPVYAYELLYPIKYLRPALDIPYCHHEKWDGTGYPRGLKRQGDPALSADFRGCGRLGRAPLPPGLPERALGRGKSARVYPRPVRAAFRPGCRPGIPGDDLKIFKPKPGRLVLEHAPARFWP